MAAEGNISNTDAQQCRPHANDQHRFTIDIRVFLVVIVVSMTISFSIGVGIIGGGAFNARKTSGMVLEELPKVTSVMVQDSVEAVAAAKLAAATAEDGEVHEPAGQHLLVDLKGVEADFLDSEERLSKAMVDTVQEAGLTMLSYHCHKLIPKGVSCVGVLLESHISFHTWPDEGVITLDLFTCGNNPLIPVVNTIQELFGIPRSTEEKVQMQWSHELRGFRTHENKENAVLDHNSDLSQLVWSPIDCVLKQQLVSKLTKFQRVDIWDVVGLEETPSHEDAVKHQLEAGDPRWLTPELVQPSRYLFLDGILQSESSTEQEYHEALVHPAMFSHPNPRQVAIVGGAEGATLREVLKHKTVDAVTMVEIDEELIGLVQEYMPYMSNCSDLVDRADNCFQDSKVNLVVDNAKSWFLEQDASQQKFDVVIVDAIEPEMGSAISKDLYDNPSVLQKMLQSLSEEGILAIQVGRAPTILDPRPDIGFNAPREALFQTLESLDEVQAMFVYEDPNCGFLEPRAFMIVCKSVSCRERFYATSDEMDYQIYDRIVLTHSKARALVYFDGVTHLGYQVAPKAWETIYCRREPMPFECDYRHLAFDKEIFEFNIENEADGAFSVTADYVDDETKREIAETHLWANVDIPKGSYIMPEHMASSLSISQQAYNNLRENLQYGGVSIIEDFVDVIDQFGHPSKAAGSSRILVEVGASYFIRQVENPEDANIGRWIPPHPAGKRPKYSPVYERHRLSFDVFMVATKDIPKGTELLRHKDMWNSE